MDAENLRPAQEARGDARDGACVTLRGWEAEHFTDHRLARDGQEDRALEVVKAIQLAEDVQVVVALFCKIDPWVEHDRIARDSGAFGERDFLREEIVEAAHHVGIADVRVRDLRRADGVHDQQRRAGLGADARVLIRRQSADVVEHVPARCERDARDFGPPSVDREDRILDFGFWILDLIPALDEPHELRRFLFRRDRAAVRTRALRADVHDVRALGDEFACVCERGVNLRDAVAGKRIRDEIHDAHHERRARELEREFPCDEPHASGTDDDLRFANRSVCV